MCRRRATVALGVRHDQASARHAAAAHAAAQLVQGRQAKALTVLDDHDSGVGHVDAYLDHRVETSTSISPCLKASITRSFSPAGMRP